MKKSISRVIMACMTLGLLVGCSGKSTGTSNPTSSDKKEIKFPTKPITMIVPFAAGGSTDVGARLLAVEAEKVLGQPITIVNTAGAGGWIGWNDLLKANKDGYTIAHLNDLSLIAGYLDPQQARKNSLKDFAPIISHVIDYNTISINPKEARFTNIKELIEYAKTHEVTATSTGAAGDEVVAMLKMNKELGTKFIPVHNKGAAESLTAVMGGHVDVMFGNVGDTKVPASNGQVKAIAVLSPERSKHLPDVPTVKEASGKEILGFSARGIGAAAGVDAKVMEVLIDAFKKAANSETFKAKMAEQGLDATSIVGDDYMKSMVQQEEDLKKLAPMLGWK